MFDSLRRSWHQRDIENRVRKHGWTAIYVGDYRTAPTWTYTIGFDETLGQPEILIFDIDQPGANALLQKAFNDLKAGLLTLTDSQPWMDCDDRLGVWRRVHQSQIDTPDGWFAAAVEMRERR